MRWVMRTFLILLVLSGCIFACGLVWIFGFNGLTWTICKPLSYNDIVDVCAHKIPVGSSGVISIETIGAYPDSIIPGYHKPPLPVTHAYESEISRTWVYRRGIGVIHVYFDIEGRYLGHDDRISY